MAERQLCLQKKSRLIAHPDEIARASKLQKVEVLFHKLSSSYNINNYTNIYPPPPCLSYGDKFVSYIGS